MAEPIPFRDKAMIRQRARITALEQANADLVAFARGHRGAAQQIHAAILAAMEAEGLDHLLHVVTQDWPDMLGLDSVVLALAAADRAVRAGTAGVQLVAAARLANDVDTPTVVMRSVSGGHPVFGPAAQLVRSEALIRIDLPAPAGAGMLALGSRAAHAFDNGQGQELLTFLGAALSRIITRWLLD